MGDTQVSAQSQAQKQKTPRLYIVSLKIHGLNVGAGFEDELIFTRIYRLGRSERNKFQYLKVRFYRLLERHAAFKFMDRYVIPETRLPKIELEFKEIYSEFVKLRDEVYRRLLAYWPMTERKIKDYLEKLAEAGVEISPSKIEKLRPPERPEDLMEMGYVVTPLSSIIESYDEAIEELARAGGVFEAIAARVAGEKERILEELREKYEEKVRELERTVENLKKALVEKSAEAEKLRLRLGEVRQDAEGIASILGGDAMADLQVRLKALEDLFAEELLKENV